MERTGKVELAELTKALEQDFRSVLAEVAQAVNDAPDGQWINASEERCRDALNEFRRKAYERALQMRATTAETTVAFSPSCQGPARADQPFGS